MFGHERRHERVEHAPADGELAVEIALHEQCPRIRPLRDTEHPA